MYAVATSRLSPVARPNHGQKLKKSRCLDGEGQMDFGHPNRSRIVRKRNAMTFVSGKKEGRRMDQDAQLTEHGALKGQLGHRAPQKFDMHRILAKRALQHASRGVLPRVFVARILQTKSDAPPSSRLGEKSKSLIRKLTLHIRHNKVIRKLASFRRYGCNAQSGTP
jgi:hypothetical protein